MQLELVQREEQLKKTKDRVSVLEGDNKALVDRWMMLKEKDANRMNEVIESETSRLAKASMSKVFSLFRSPLSDATPIEVPEQAFQFQSSVLPTRLEKTFVRV